MKDTNVFSWDDPFLIEGQLTEEERMIRDSAHAYAQEKLLPRVEHAFLAEETDPEIFREMGVLGLLGITVPEEYGGVGGGAVGRGRVRGESVARECEEVGRKGWGLKTGGHWPQVIVVGAGVVTEI